MVQLVLAVVLLTVQAAGREGAAAGTFTLNGTTVTLTHAYASAQPGFFDKRTEDVRVLLSDVPLDDATRADVFAIRDLARAGRAHVIEVLIDATGSPIGGTFFSKEFDGMVSAAGMHVFTRERLERTAIAGRLSASPPQAFMGVTYAYDVRFSAPIPRAPTPAELAASLASPPAIAAGRYVAAVRRGALAPFLATMTTAAAAGYRNADGQDRLAELSADMPADSRVVGLEPQTDGSVLAHIEGHAGGIVIGYTVKMVRDGAVWKVGN